MTIAEPRGPAGPRLMGSWTARTTNRLTTSLASRRRAFALLWQAGHGLTIAVLLFIVLDAALPNLSLIMLGLVTGQIPKVIAQGLDSPVGHRLYVQLGIAGVSYALSLLRGPIQNLLRAACQTRVTTVMQRRLAEAVSAPPGIEHLDEPEVLDRLSSATGELISARPADAPMTLADVLASRLSGLFACVAIGAFRWWLGVLFLVGWLVTRRALHGLWISRASLARQATSRLRHSWYYMGLSTRPAAAKEVRLFGIGGWVVDRIRELWLQAMKPSWDELRRTRRRSVLLGLLVFGMCGIALGELGWAAYHREVGLQVLAVVLTMLPLTMQVAGISLNSIMLEQMLVAIPDFDGLVTELHARARTLSGDRPAAGLPATDIRLEDVHYRYPGSDSDVLDGVDLVLPAGQSLAVVGTNGAGKTTLVTLLARLRDVTGGRILVDGVPISELRPREWQRQVAVVYQDATHFPFSVRENVAVRTLATGVDEKALAGASARSDLTKVVDGLPAGWDTILSTEYEGGTDLSGGQWQRVVLARGLYAVAQGARVLILDEPTAQLDVRAEAAFYTRFLELTKGATTIIISHRFSTVRRADRIAVLHDGRIAELGSHDELMAADGRYAEMFRLQTERFQENEKGPAGDGDRAGPGQAAPDQDIVAQVRAAVRSGDLSKLSPELRAKVAAYRAKARPKND